MEWSWSNIDVVKTLSVICYGFAAVTVLSMVAVFSTRTPQDKSLAKSRPEIAQRRLRTRFLIASSASLILVAATSWIVVVAENDPKGIYGSNTASWAQAIGSILAILGAAGIAGWEAHHQRVVTRRLERSTRVDRVISMSTVATRLAKRLEEKSRELSQAPHDAPRLLRAFQTELHVAANRMSGLFDIGLGSSVVETWVSAEAQLASLRANLEFACEAWGRGEATVEHLARVRSDLAEVKSAMISVAAACLGPHLKSAIGNEAP